MKTGGRGRWVWHTAGVGLTFVPTCLVVETDITSNDQLRSNTILVVAIFNVSRFGNYRPRLAAFTKNY